MNSDSIQEGNQSIHMYFEDKGKKRKKQRPNSKFVIIIMQITKQRHSEALSQDPFIGHNCLDNVRNYFYGYYEIIYLEPFISVLSGKF
jgi:hypothetical protein